MLSAQLQFWIFFVISPMPEVVKTNLSGGHEPQGTIDTLEVYFYHKPSLILMRFINMQRSSFIYLINYFVNIILN